MALQTLRCDGVGRHLRPGRRRLRALHASTRTWTVPHFEKMLYDNALLARAYLHGWLVSGDPLLRRTCEETLDWALREMRGAGRRLPQLARRRLRGRGGHVLRVDDRRAASARSAPTRTPRSPGSARPTPGNFEGPGVQRPGVARRRSPSPRCASGSARALLRGARAARAARRLDDKRLTAWNALMIARARRRGRRARSARTTSTPRARRARVLLDVAARRRRAAAAHLQPRASRKQPRFLEDHAFLLEALLTLYEATFEERWFLAARALADELICCGSPTPSTAASSPPPTTRGADRAAQGARGPPRSPPAPRRRRSACCGSRC